jgi:hypothetical protein
MAVAEVGSWMLDKMSYICCWKAKIRAETGASGNVCQMYAQIRSWSYLSASSNVLIYFYHNLPWDLQLEEKIPRGQECALETRYMDVNDGLYKAPATRFVVLHLPWPFEIKFCQLFHVHIVLLVELGNDPFLLVHCSECTSQNSTQKNDSRFMHE